MKYGKYEYERSFIVNSDVLNLEVKEVKQIADTYLTGIGLRLRKVERKNVTQYKLTQKKEAKPVRTGVKRINTIYLSADEYEELNKLAGYRIEKARHILEVDQRRIGVDLIKLNEEALYLAEVEFETEAKMNAYILPFSYVREVTTDPECSGFEIARRYSNDTW
jgi:CYTH domain-containing protein